MADPMKIRAELKGDFADIRVLMFHPMETGQRRDPKTGDFVSARYIQSITATLNGTLVFEGQISQAVSRNPIFGFRVKGAKVGDKVVITWIDSKGDQRTDETVIVAAN